MTAITVANADWAIVSAIQTALTNATIGGSTVFAAVTVSTTDAQFKECAFKDSPIATVLYETTRENSPGPDEVVPLAVDLEIIVAAKVNQSTWDYGESVKEGQRLANAAKNAVESISDATIMHGWGDSNYYHRRLEWGGIRIDATTVDPWVVVRIPVSISVTIASATAH